MAAWLAAATLFGLLLINAPTVRSIVHIWSHDRAFAHGYFIAPLAGYMIWRNRERLALASPRPSLWGVAAVFFAGALWLLSNFAQIQVGAQLSLVAMLVATLWAVLGGEVVRLIAYPLSFLFLAVPFGEGFFPILIAIAGKLAAIIVSLLGAPIAFDGRFLRLPGAEWRVAEACGGLRFILALLAVGALFAYTVYRKPYKRALFLVACVVLAVFTNGLRVSAIVLIGYFTDMKSSIVHEHTWLGWLFFAIMAMVLFFIGARWSDSDPSGTPPPRTRGNLIQPSGSDIRSFAAAGISVIAITAGWHLYAKAAERPDRRLPVEVSLAAPQGTSGWAALDYRPWDWTPYYKGSRASFETAYQRQGGTVTAYAAYYRNQTQGSELAQAQNGILPPTVDPGWRPSVDTPRTVQVGNRNLEVTQTDLRSPVMNLRVWRWYWTPTGNVSSPAALKLLALRSRLLGHGDDAAVVIVAAPFERTPEEGSRELTEYLKAMLPRLEGALQRASGNP
jgi:exosortase A